MKYKYIIFDYDGTLADSKRGIKEGAKRALNKFGITATDSELQRFVGPDLWYSFGTFYGFDRKAQDKAVEYYREYYNVTGIYDVNLYDGMADTLNALKEAGCLLSVATAKPEETVLKALDYLKITDMFSVIAGSFPNGERSNKKELSLYVMDALKVKNKAEVIYIGDSLSDYTGADAAGIDFMAAVYDRPESEFATANVKYTVRSAEEIKKILL